MKNIEITELLEKHLLPFVEKPARYLGSELHVIHKPLNNVDLRFALAFPEVYEIAMSSQATGLLYHQLNQLETVWAERVFAPWVDAEKQLRAHHIPLCSLESFTPLHQFDVVGFTLQYELTYTNILNMLDLGGIPVWAKDRGEDDPIVLGGGPSSCNPEPMAAFFDAFYIGDAEAGLSEFCQTVATAKKAGATREQILERLAGLRGVYVPAFYKDSYDAQGTFTGLKPVHAQAPAVIRTQIVPALTEDHYPRKPLVPIIEVTHDRLAVEVMRGCTEGCRYCNAGMIYRPTRARDEDDIVSFSKETLRNTGYEEISFLSLSISDYPTLPSLMKKESEALAADQINFSLPSMRLDSFNAEIADFAKTVRKSGFTFAPEAGSDRLRKVINKNISDEDLMQATDIALKNGWKTLKFYFMIGLPTETKEDVEGIADLIGRVVQAGKKYGRSQINVSISPYSPKPHTPFQWERQDTKEELLEKVRLIREKIKQFNQVKLNWRDPEVSQLECILGRGDRRLSEIIFQVWKKGGRFEGWSDQFRYDRWQEAFAGAGLAMDRLTMAIAEENALPWDHIDKGVSRQFLLKERANGYKGIMTGDCKDGRCHTCGIQRKPDFSPFADCYLDADTPVNETKGQVKIDHTSDRPAAEKTEILSEPYRYRIHYQKVGFGRYIGHLDVVRNFERACRRASIKVAHSQGFNPRPRFSFGPPLRLGYASLAEYVDVLVYEVSAADLMQSLNDHLPEGLNVIQIVPVTSTVTSLTAAIAAARYRVDLENEDELNGTVNKLMAQSVLPIIRRVKGKDKEIDIRPFIESIRQDGNVLTIETRNIESRAVRVDEILHCLLPDSANRVPSLPVTRERQLIMLNGSLCSPMDIR